MQCRGAKDSCLGGSRNLGYPAEKTFAPKYTLVLGRINTNAGWRPRLQLRIRELSGAPMKKV
jgi:hypothetical protein